MLAVTGLARGRYRNAQVEISFKLMYAAVLRAVASRRGVTVAQFEPWQMRVLRDQLNRSHTVGRVHLYWRWNSRHRSVGRCGLVCSDACDHQHQGTSVAPRRAHCLTELESALSRMPHGPQQPVARCLLELPRFGGR